MPTIASCRWRGWLKTSKTGPKSPIEVSFEGGWYVSAESERVLPGADAVHERRSDRRLRRQPSGTAAAAAVLPRVGHARRWNTRELRGRDLRSENRRPGDRVHDRERVAAGRDAAEIQRSEQGARRRPGGRQGIQRSEE